ncbi:phenazine biosynthesis protein PhzF [bacterium TMED181]|nr:phenazine biosynthesis protein PhzF [Planctomycetota bacterium]OUW45809.1 MAG: phenazine biosynthesis protein PhzF [bacterium TMED181]
MNVSTLLFDQVDVFGSSPYLGNPLAVVHDAVGFSTEEMARFARWTNLSETTFLLPPTDPEADYRVRIFTPEGELPFAGHPTLGSAWTWLNRGGKPQQDSLIIQECGIGKVRIRKLDQGLAFAAPGLLREGPVDDSTLQTICSGLSIDREEIVDHHWVDNGPGWAAVLLKDSERVLSIDPDFSQLKEINFGIIGPGSPQPGADFEMRAFVESLSIPEDPVTGSLAAGIALWFSRTGYAPDQYMIHQGTALDRSGIISISNEHGSTWVGGEVHPGISGHLEIL